MIPYPLSRPFALLALLLLAAPLLAIDLTGRVTAVGDGDTMTLLVPDGASFKQVKVRLGEIDTPESRQPYGERAKQTLSDLAFGKPARVVVQDTDRYGRTVGRVYVGNLDVNAEMIGRGAAWGLPAIRERPVAVPAGKRGQGGEAGPVGAAGSATLRALGLAQECVPDVSGDAGFTGRQRAESGYRRRFHLRRQAVLPRNDELRRGEVLPLAVRRGFPRREQRWRAVRESVPLT